VTVNVAANAPATVTNTASIQGSGARMVSASDSAKVFPWPAPGRVDQLQDSQGAIVRDRTACLHHHCEQYGRRTDNRRSYRPLVGHLAGRADRGVAQGTGWSCTLGHPIGCDRTDQLPPGASYPRSPLL